MVERKHPEAQHLIIAIHCDLIGRISADRTVFPPNVLFLPLLPNAPSDCPQR